MSAADDALRLLAQSDRPRLYARLVTALGNFEVAEDALQDAFHAAARQWEHEGMPDNPASWLLRVARFKGIDALRKRRLIDVVDDLEAAAWAEPDLSLEEIGDELLRLIFTCCHPSISPEAQTALTLREVCGLTTEEIARAFLAPAPTIAQRIVRAKAKIREAKIPFEVPQGKEKRDRLGAVLRTIYLVFNEGYSASAGEDAIRKDLVEEAIRLGRLVAEMLPESEVCGLLALMLLNRSRMRARLNPAGEIVLLEDQDRARWDRASIAEGADLVTKALSQPGYGTYALQAAISAVHCEAPTYRETDWNEIIGLYDALLRVEPSPVAELNRAAAVAMRDGPEVGIELINRILGAGELSDYHLAYAARAALFVRAGKLREASADYSKAMQLATNDPERQFVAKRLLELGAAR